MKILLIIIGILILSGCNSTDNLFVSNNVSQIEKIVEGDSMEPLIEDGSGVLFSSGFYDDEKKNDVKLGDIVLYDFKGEEHAIIKSVVARDSDNIEFKNNSLFVNKKEVKNSEGKSYNFSQAERRVMKLYINKEGKIPKNSVFILGDNVKNSRDSRKFGAVSMNDILGKVNLKK